MRRRRSPCFACGCYAIGRGADPSAGWLCAGCHSKLSSDPALAARTRAELEARVLRGRTPMSPGEARALFASLLELTMLDTPA